MTLHSFLVEFSSFLFLLCTFLQAVYHLIWHASLHPVLIHLMWVLLDHFQLLWLHLHLLQNLGLGCKLEVRGLIGFWSLLFSHLVESTIDPATLFFLWFVKHALNLGLTWYLKFAILGVRCIDPKSVPFWLVLILFMIFLQKTSLLQSRIRLVL